MCERVCVCARVRARARSAFLREVRGRLDRHTEALGPNPLLRALLAERDASADPAALEAEFHEAVLAVRQALHPAKG